MLPGDAYVFMHRTKSLFQPWNCICNWSRIVRVQHVPVNQPGPVTLLWGFKEKTAAELAWEAIWHPLGLQRMSSRGYEIKIFCFWPQFSSAGMWHLFMHWKHFIVYLIRDSSSELHPQINTFSDNLFKVISNLPLSQRCSLKFQNRH